MLLGRTCLARRRLCIDWVEATSSGSTRIESVGVLLEGRRCRDEPHFTVVQKQRYRWEST